MEYLTTALLILIKEIDKLIAKVTELEKKVE
jgi:hypothetical protein